MRRWRVDIHSHQAISAGAIAHEVFCISTGSSASPLTCSGVFHSFFNSASPRTGRWAHRTPRPLIGDLAYGLLLLPLVVPVHGQSGRTRSRQSRGGRGLPSAYDVGEEVKGRPLMVLVPLKVLQGDEKGRTTGDPLSNKKTNRQKRASATSKTW